MLPPEIFRRFAGTGLSGSTTPERLVLPVDPAMALLPTPFALGVDPLSIMERAALSRESSGVSGVEVLFASNDGRCRGVLMGGYAETGIKS
jgi:hypothetical protein